MGFNMKPQPYASSTRGKGSDSFRGIGTCFTARNAGFYLTTKKPPTVQVEFILRYLNFLLKFGGLECPFDLTLFRAQGGFEYVTHTCRSGLDMEHFNIDI